MTRSLREVIEGVYGLYILNEADKRFIGSFGTPEKPVTLREFLEFWSTLTDAEKNAIWMDYEPEMHPGTEGFKG